MPALRSLFRGPGNGTDVPRKTDAPPHETIRWAQRELPAEFARQSHYRISGITGSGKTHLIKLFLLDALREVERNDAKLIVFEPKREFYAWVQTVSREYNYTFPISYFMPSDKRGATLEFWRDYPSDQDSRTLANAFYPQNPNEVQRFWGDALRTIYAQVFDAIKGQLGYADLRLMCLVLEDEHLTRALLETDPYLKQARVLVEENKERGDVGKTANDIRMTIHSRVAEMKVLATHLELARSEGRVFSLSRFVNLPAAGVLVVSKDPTYSLVHDPMNGVIFLRLMELLDRLQEDAARRVFVVIDELPMLTGDKPCPGLENMLLLLRSRGVSLLFTYQAHASLKRIYGEEKADEIVGQVANVIYLTQGDPNSAEYAARDLGNDRGFEPKTTSTISTGMSGNMPSSSYGVATSLEYFERPRHSHTELMGLKPASPERGVTGFAKSPAVSDRPFPFTYRPEEIAAIPKSSPDFPDYVRRDPDLGEDDEKDPVEIFKLYIEHMRKTQRLNPLSPPEKADLLRSRADRPESESWDQCQD